MQRRGPAGEDQESAISHVLGEIDEDVDAILADFLCEIGVAHADGGDPIVAKFFKLCGEGIGSPGAAVGEDLELIVVVMGEQREHESADGMEAKVGGDVAEAEFAEWLALRGRRSGRCAAAWRCARRHERRGEGRCPLFTLGAKCWGEMSGWKRRV